MVNVDWPTAVEVEEDSVSHTGGPIGVNLRKLALVYGSFIFRHIFSLYQVARQLLKNTLFLEQFAMPKNRCGQTVCHSFAQEEAILSKEILFPL